MSKYHGGDNCLNVLKRREETTDGHYLDIHHCIEHEVETCRCGWEWSKHFDDLSEGTDESLSDCEKIEDEQFKWGAN